MDPQVTRLSLWYLAFRGYSQSTLQQKFELQGVSQTCTEACSPHAGGKHKDGVEDAPIGMSHEKEPGHEPASRKTHGRFKSEGVLCHHNEPKAHPSSGMTASPPPPPSSLKILMAFIQYISAVLSVASAVSQGPLQAAITRFLNFTLKKDARKVTKFPQLCR